MVSYIISEICDTQYWVNILDDDIKLSENSIKIQLCSGPINNAEFLINENMIKYFNVSYTDLKWYDGELMF